MRIAQYALAYTFYAAGCILIGIAHCLDKIVIVMQKLAEKCKHG
jgi:ACR3 family arsenite efflux pump ArsB